MKKLNELWNDCLIIFSYYGTLKSTFINRLHRGGRFLIIDNAEVSISMSPFSDTI